MVTARHLHQRRHRNALVALSSVGVRGRIGHKRLTETGQVTNRQGRDGLGTSHIGVPTGVGAIQAGLSHQVEGLRGHDAQLGVVLEELGRQRHCARRHVRVDGPAVLVHLELVLLEAVPKHRSVVTCDRHGVRGQQATTGHDGRGTQATRPGAHVGQRVVQEARHKGVLEHVVKQSILQDCLQRRW